MGLRSAIATRLTRAALALGGPEAPEPSTAVEKAFGSNEPPAMAIAARDVSQMDMGHPFAPGEPIGPYDGYSRTPRSFDYQTAVNIATRPRTHELVSFDALKGLIGAYDVASICIWHRIDSLRSLDWKLVSADGYSGDVTDAIAVGMAALEKPDRINSFGTWLAKYLYNILAYDAGALYRMRNRAGKCVGLKPVDGPSIAPLLDYWGDPPEAPAEAYVQYANGLPWGWLTRDDLIYEPFRPRTDSPYGTAPLESIMLNANTDVRFQWHFLQRFTEGNIPAAFASAPESWSPEQIEAFQNLWDSFMYGDQSRKSQIRWLPGGSQFTWTNEKDFTDAFSLFMMRKSCAAYHIVPTDIGFTENSNYSTGESQADVGHRVGDLPLGRHVERILTGFLQSKRNGLGLPLKHQFDWGEEQDDRLNQAQADDINVKNGTLSVSEVRQMRFGLAEPEGQVVPRFIYSPRAGAIPLSALMDVAGPVDPQTAAPEPGVPLPHHEFAPIEGVVPVPPPKVPALAERLYGPDAIPPPPPEQAPVAKEAAALPAGGTEGITSETGIVGYDGPGHRDDDDEDGSQEEVLKELATFRRFAKTRLRAGQWRDFEFRALSAADARSLNTAGRRAVVTKATGCDISPRSGMISLDLPEGLIEPVPGGVTDFHITVVYLGQDVDDAALAVAIERAQEGAAALPGPLSGVVSGLGTFPPSGSSDGKTPVWAAVALPGAEALRDALADLSASEHPDWTPHVTLAYTEPGEPLPAPLDPVPVTFTHLSVHLGGEVVASIPLGATEVAKAAPAPKASAPPGASQPATQPPPAQQAWPGWQYDLAAIAFWVPVIIAALAAALSAKELAEAWLKLALTSSKGTKDEQTADLTVEARKWLTGREKAIETALGDAVRGARTDGYAIGAAASRAVTAGLGSITADMGGWTPGATQIARALAGELGDGKGLADLLDQAGVTIKSIASTELDRLARTLAIGTVRGSSAEDLARVIGEFLTDPSRAEMIVGTELARASNAAAVANYQRAGVREVIWVGVDDDRECPTCLANEAASPRPLGDDFPSGDKTPPAHPRCRCVVIPLA